MDQLFISASLLILLLASAAAVEGRMVRSVFDDDKPVSRPGAARLLTSSYACQRTCDQVQFNAICRALAKFPGVSTPRQLLLVSIRVAAQKAKDTKAKVDTYGVRSHDGGPMASIISTCNKSYDDMAQSLEETWGLIEAQGTQFAGLNTKVSAATTFAGDCSTTFDDFSDIPSLFAAVQKNVFRMVDNILNIADFVQQADAHAHRPHGH